MARINLDFGLPDLRAGLMGAASAVGGIGGQIKEKQKREADKDALSQLTPYSSDYYNEVARQLIRDGKKTEAIRFQELARQIKDRQTSIAATTKALGDDLGGKRQAAKDFASIGQFTEAMNVTNAVRAKEIEKGKTALARYMRGISDKGGDLQSLNVRKGFDGIANAYGLSFEDASEIFEEASSQYEQNQLNNNLADAIKEEYPKVSKAVKAGDPEAKKYAYKILTNNLKKDEIKDIDFKFGTATDRLRDREGNLYLLSTIKDPTTGEVTAVHTPVGDAPEYNPETQGPLEYISRVGETPGEQRAGEVQQEDEIEWRRQRGEMLIKFTGAPQIVEKAERAIEALENINTSGFDATVKQVTDFTGTTSADIGVFNSSVSDFILESLGQLGANPTEGEREFLIQASASLKTSKSVNRALLNRIKNTYLDIVERGRWLVKNPKASRDEYANWMLSPSEEDVLTFDAEGNRING